MVIHTDTLNESGFVEDTIAAFKGRTIHTITPKAPAAVTRRTSSRSAAEERAAVVDQSDAALHRSTPSTSTSTC